MREFVAGRLPGDARARAQQHLEQCSVCRMVAVELTREGDTEQLPSQRSASLDTAAAFASGSATCTIASATGEVSEHALSSLTGRFQIIRPLGRGGMGVVYEALDLERHARIAIKTLPYVSADGLLRFKNEFRAVQDVQHPNLVTLGELIEHRGQWWFTMELIDGVQFLAHVRPGGILDEARLRAALVQLASGLQALHARGLVHRDVKPHNVLVTAAGRVVLLDFGLVVHVDQSESNVVGTAAYMAPEQAMVQEIGPPADWYAVGALLYHALTGMPPFTGALLQVLATKQQALPRPPRELAPVPEDLEALCMELLAVEPAARPDVYTVLSRLAPSAIRTVPAAAPLPLFVGRSRELDVLEGAFAETCAGEEAIVLIQGESGIGKSALVRHFCDELRRREPAAVVLAGKCYERETVPYKAFDGVVDALARHLRKLPAADIEIVLPRRAGLLVQAFPVLARVPALRALPSDGALEPRELRIRAFSAMRELLGRLAGRFPLVLCIDDLQWADADSLELLGYVMAPPEAPPFLLVMTSRPPRVGAIDASVQAGMARLRDLAGLRLLELERLSREESMSLVEHLLAGAPRKASAESVVDEAAGHPFFIETLAGFVATDADARPGMRLADVLWARVSALDEPTRQLLFLASVAGWPLSPEIVVALAALPADQLEAAIVRLRQAHLVRLADGPGKGALEPYHDRVREAVLDHMDAETRQQCHGTLARALLEMSAADRLGAVLPPPGEPASPDAHEPPGASNASREAEIIAVHLHGAGELGQAARYMVMAADRAAAMLAFDRAARLYRQALDLHAQAGAPVDAGNAGGVREVLARLARALAHASRGAEAAAVYLELARMSEATGDDDMQIRLLAAEQFLRSGHVQEGQRVLDPVLDQLGMSRATTRAGVVWGFLWRRAWLRVRGFGYRERQPTELTTRELLGIDACRAAWMNAWSPDFLARYQLMALRAGEPVRVGVALFFECFYAVLRGAADAPRTARIAEQLTGVAERADEPYLRGLAAAARCLIEYWQGHWSLSRAHGARALQLFRECGADAAHEATFALGGYLHSMIHMGDFHDLLRELPPLLRDAEERRDRFTLAALHNGPVMFHWLIQDQPVPAQRQIREAMDLWKPDEQGNQLVLGEIWQTLIELYQGEGAAAYHRIDQGLRQKLHMPVVRGWLLVGHGVAALAACQSGGGDARKLVREAARDARGLRAMHLRWTDALARILDAGVAVVMRDHARARNQLERAHEELTAAGMMLCAMMMRRRLGELTGGAEGRETIAATDAWLAARGVVSPERLARLYVPEIP